MKAYKVNAGHRFVIPGEEVVEAGGTVYLDDNEAQRFAQRVTLKKSKAAQPAAVEVTPAVPPAAAAKQAKASSAKAK